MAVHPDNPSQFGFAATWHYTQQVYSYDSHLLAELMRAEFRADSPLPTELLYRLPGFCPYVHFPDGLLYGDGPDAILFDGFFAMLDHTPEGSLQAYNDELRIGLLNRKGGIFEIILDLGKDTIQASIDSAIDRAVSNLQAFGKTDGFVEDRGAWTELTPKLISVLLYLIADEGDYQWREAPAVTMPRPPGKRIKGKMRLLPPKRPKIVPVGETLGPKIRRHYERQSAEVTGDRKSPRPHIRAPHWHTYWTGPKSAQKPVLKFLSPIFVSG
jgi:hypothetical protein